MVGSMLNHHASASHGSRRRSGSRGSFTAASERQLVLDFDSSAALPPIVDRAHEQHPASCFALRFATLLETDPAARFDNGAISSLAREIFGSSAGYARDAYDAAEAGFNIYLNRIDFNLCDTNAAIDRLLAEQARLPLQTRRDQNQIDFQQFSTPPAQAVIVVKAAACCAGMTVLEPSAGSGNIAVLARLAGADVETNEIDERRRELLSLQGFQPTAFDAERLNNLLPTEKSYHAIVMNPPFSATGGRVNGHRTAFGARHIEQALLRVKPGGRLVAIVGRGMALERPAFRDWWAAIAERYQVRANVGIDGRQYAKFGTTFDNQIIVIDHTGPTPDLSAIVIGKSLSVREAFERLKDLSEEDVYGRVSRNEPQARSTLAKADVSAGGNERDGPDSGIDRLPPRGRSGRGNVAHGIAADNGPLADLEPNGAIGPESNGRNGWGGFGTRATGSADLEGIAPKLGGLSSPLHARIHEHDIGQIETAVAPQCVDIEEGTVFAAYRVQKAVVRGAQPHPANVVESTAMACVEPPDVTYRHHLPADVIAEGRVSNLQLEDVIYAGQATSALLPDGSRKGQWNGDGTGIGKGREIYAFVYNELEQRRAKHVHVSASHQLCADAERDRDAVGLPLPIIHQARFKTNEPIPGDRGVLFTTYTMLRRHDRIS